MTMRTYTHLACPCGHHGTLVESENDQPYSTEWSSIKYRDEDMRETRGGTHSTFAEAGMKCPACGT